MNTLKTTKCTLEVANCKVCALYLNKVVIQNKMTQSVNERVAPRSGGELSLALAHTLGPQCEDCFMGDTAAGIMKKRQEDKVNRSRTPIPPVRMARSLLDPKNTRMHLFEHPNPHP